MKIAFNPSTTAISNVPDNDIVFDLNSKKVWAKGIRMGADWNDISNKPSSLPAEGGNADTATAATKLQTARSLWGNNFDGTANINGTITFPSIGDTATSNKITWNGSTDGADIYYQTTTADQGNLVLNVRDDNNCYIQLAYNGTFKSHFDVVNSYWTGRSAAADRWTTARSFTIGNSTKSVDGTGNVTWTLSEIGFQNTWRDIQANGTSIGSNILNLVNGSNVNLVRTNGTIRINAANTWRDVQVNSSTINSNTLNLVNGNNVSLVKTNGTVSINAQNTWRTVQVNGTSIGSNILNLKGSTFIGLSNSNGAVTLNLIGSTTTPNLVIMSNGTTNGWKLQTLNIDNWNSAYSWILTITQSDTDGIINKWGEITNFLDGISSDDKLNTLLNSKLSLYTIANNTDVSTIKNTGIHYSTTDANSGTLTNSPFANNFALLNINTYDNGDDLRRVRLAFNGYGEIKISNDRGYTNTTEAWYNILTSNNSRISDNTVTINGASKDYAYKDHNHNSSYVTALGTSGNYLTWTKNGTTNNITVPYATSALSSNYLKDLGVHTETASGTTANEPNAGMLYGSGMYMTKTYSDSNMPTSYGNVLNLAGSGSGLLLLGWMGLDSVTGNVYYRSHRDTATGGWGAWRRLMYADELPSSIKNPNAIKFRNINGAEVSYDGSAAVDLTAGTYIAKLPYGFNSWASGVTWGNTTGTSFASWNDSTGGSIDFRRDNPSSGKMSIKVDGRVYVNEGYNPVLSSEHNNGFWGMRTPDGGNDWIRTPNNGLIPYVSGAAGSGHSSLGTSSWYFSTAYIDNIYGSLKGNADTVTNGVYVFNRTAIGTSPNYDNPGVNGFFEYRDDTEVTGRTGTRPLSGYGAFLNLKTPDNILMLQIAGVNGSLLYRTKHAENATMSGISWIKLLDVSNSSVLGNKITINGVSTTWTNTWRDIQLNGSSIGSNVLNLKAGNNVTMTKTNGTVTVNAINTWRDVQVNNSSINSNSLNLVNGNNISLVKTNGTVTVNAINTWRSIQVNGTSIGNSTLNLKAGSGISLSNSSGTVTITNSGVLVTQHNANDVNYPIVWSNLNSTNTVVSNLLYKSYADLCYNPSNKKLIVGGSIQAPNYSGNWEGYTNSLSTTNTTDTWVPVLNNNLIQHRVIPEAYNNDPSTLTVGAANRLKVTLYLTSTDTDKYPILWGGNSHNNTNTATGEIYKSYSALTWQNSSLTLYSTNIQTTGLTFPNITTGMRGISGTVGDNDFWRIMGGATASNAGYLEIATADDGNEPIYVRQYSGVFSTAARTLTLLDENGHSHFPSYVSIGGNENNNSSPDRVWGSNSSDSYLRSYKTSALSVKNSDTLDSWHKDNINWTSYVTSPTASLSHYWGKLWEVTLDNQYNDLTMTFLASASYSPSYFGIFSVNLRQNGSGTSKNISARLVELVGNFTIGSDNLRLYVNNTTGNCLLWGNVKSQYGTINLTVLKKSWRTETDTTSIGTLYNTTFTTAQTLPDSNWTLYSLTHQAFLGNVHNADLLDNYHANALFESIANVSTTNQVSVKIGGTTKYLKVNADTVDGYHVATPNSTNFSALTSKIPVIDSAGVMEIGRYIDFHTGLTSAVDYNVRLVPENSSSKNIITLPAKSGTIALTSDITSSGNYLPLTGGTLTGPLTITGVDLDLGIIFKGGNDKAGEIYSADTSLTMVETGLHIESPYDIYILGGVDNITYDTSFYVNLNRTVFVGIGDVSVDASQITLGSATNTPDIYIYNGGVKYQFDIERAKSLQILS